MTDNTQELDDILFDLCDLSYASFTTQEEADRVADQLDYDRAKAKQALASLIKELVAEAKPELKEVVRQIPGDMDSFLHNQEAIWSEQYVTEFEQNLLKALEEVE